MHGILRRKPNAFTLVELLVVIGIITVLVAVSLPMVSRAKASAYQTVCLNNMRQITAACMEYAASSDGQLPYCNWAGSGPQDTSVYGYGWLFSSTPYRANVPGLSGSWSSLPHYPPEGVRTGVLWQYLNTLTVYHCPSDDPAFYIGTNWMTSYLYNGSQCGFGASGVVATTNAPGAPLRRFKTPSQSIMFWESMEQKYENQVAPTGWNDGSSFPSDEVLADRHFKGANVSCFDGHVEWWDPGTWAFNCNTSGPSRLWCSPYSASGH